MAILSGLLPVILLIATGFGLKQARIIADSHWVGLERISYLVFFPAIVIHTLAMADLRGAPVVALGGTLVLAIISMLILLLIGRLVLRRLRLVDDRSFTSVVQGSLRWNTFVALALAQSLFGSAGLSLMAISVAAMIPLLNVVSILVLIRFAAPAGTVMRPATVARTLATNPFIWSCAVGIVLNVSGLKLWGPIASYSNSLGAAALSAGLLVVGAALDLKRLRRFRWSHGLAIALKLALMPALVWFYAITFGLSDMAFIIAIIAGSVPTASASYILAKQFNGDVPLMAEIVTIQTLVSIATIALWLSLAVG